MSTLTSRFSQNENLASLFNGALIALAFSGMMRGLSSAYITPYLDAQGFSASQIGILTSIAAFLELSLIPLLSMWSDRANRQRRLFRSIVLGYALTALLIGIFPQEIMLMVGFVVLNMSMNAAFLFGVQLGFSSAMQKGKANFGHFRTASAVGFISGNYLVSYLFGMGGYATIFIASSIAGAAATLFAQGLPVSTIAKEVKLSTPQPRRKAMYVVFASQFFTLLGIRSGYAFWLLHFQDRLHMDISQVSLVVVLAGLLEIPFFLYMDRLVKRFKSTQIYIWSAIGLGLGWVMVGAVTGVGWLILILFYRGMMFGLWNMSILLVINEQSHPANVSTNQAWAQITIPSLAMLIGGAPMGSLYEHGSPLMYFGVCATFTVLGGILLMGGLAWLEKREGNPNQSLPKQVS